MLPAVVDVMLLCVCARLDVWVRFGLGLGPRYLLTGLEGSTDVLWDSFTLKQHAEIFLDKYT